MSQARRVMDCTIMALKNIAGPMIKIIYRELPDTVCQCKLNYIQNICVKTCVCARRHRQYIDMLFMCKISLNTGKGSNFDLLQEKNSG